LHEADKELQKLCCATLVNMTRTPGVFASILAIAWAQREPALPSSADNCARVITTEGALELLVLCCAANASNPDLQHQSVWVLCNLSQPIGACSFSLAFVFGSW
jgi:hypothetical protein